MSDWRYIDDEEFDREYAAVRERVFGRVVGDVGGEKTPFPDPTWQLVPMLYTPFGMRVSEEERPCGYPPIEPCFPNYYDPLYLTLAELGIEEVVATTRWDGGTREPDGRYHGVQPGTDDHLQCHVLVRPTAKNFHEAEDDSGKSSAWSVMDTHCYFSREGGWGLLTQWEDVAMLGGPPDFIETFYRISGGRRAARAHFLYFMWEAGCGVPYGGLFTPTYYMTRNPLVRMHRQAGWPLPNRWFVWNGEEIDWSWMMDDEGFPET
jgi:hypothetical protein